MTEELFPCNTEAYNTPVQISAFGCLLDFVEDLVQHQIMNIPVIEHPYNPSIRSPI